jgi:excinuclease ABC subunit A
LVVVSGVSGSGKSSLAFDTLFAEGQRRYVESLSAYARQFLGRMQKPDVDFIEGIPPAIAIEQKVTNRNPRSTVGTVTEIYEYLKLLYARAGVTLSPISHQEVKRHTINDVVDCLRKQTIGNKVFLLSPIKAENPEEQISIWQQQGFSRLYRIHPDGSNEILRIGNYSVNNQTTTYLLVDRIVADGEQTTINRFADSVQTAFFEGKGECMLLITNTDNDEQQYCFSERFEADGITFIEPTEHLFDFNSPLGACPTCGGYGNVIGIDPDLVVPDKSKSIYEGAIACWRGDKMSAWNDALIYSAEQFDFPIHTPFYALTPEQKQLIWTGNEHFLGLNSFFHQLESKQHAKIQYRVMLSRYRGKATCPDCNGLRLRQEAQYVWVGNKRITDLCQMPITELAQWFEQLTTDNPNLKETFGVLLTEIQSRLQFMQDVGLGYLTLSRMSATLSGGEGQRINLAKSLGSSLVGSLYVLDEPSIGLHPRDTQRLIHVLEQLRDLGNTIVVVEHDDEI